MVLHKTSWIVKVTVGKLTVWIGNSQSPNQLLNGQTELVEIPTTSKGFSQTQTLSVYSPPLLSILQSFCLLKYNPCLLEPDFWESSKCLAQALGWETVQILELPQLFDIYLFSQLSCLPWFVYFFTYLYHCQLDLIFPLFQIWNTSYRNKYLDSQTKQQQRE